MAASRDITSLLASATTKAELIRLYERTIRQIIQDMAKGISAPGGERVRQLLARINEQLIALDPTKASSMRRWIKKNIPRAFVLGDRNASAELRKQLLIALEDPTSVVRGWTIVNATQMATVVNAMEITTKAAVESIRRDLQFVVRRTQLTLSQNEAMRRITVDGLLRGRTGQQVRDDLAAMLLKDRVPREVRERLKAIGFRSDMFARFERIARQQLITAGSRTFTVGSYADLVARTQMREAHTVGTLARLQQNGINHVRITSPPQKDKDECTPWAGKVFYVGPLTKDPAGFRPLRQVPNGGPPFHPNCRHVITPYVIRLRGDQEVETRRASSAGIPRRFMGKDAGEVRKLVAEMPEEEISRLFSEGFKAVA